MEKTKTLKQYAPAEGLQLELNACHGFSHMQFRCQLQKPLTQRSGANLKRKENNGKLNDDVLLHKRCVIFH